MNKFFGKYFLAAAALLLFVWGCEDRSDITAPEPDIKNVDFSSYVAIGNSLTAGYQNNALYEESQMYSIPALIAGQVETQMVQPLISNPGIPGRMQVNDLVVSNGQIQTVVLGQDTEIGNPLNLDYSSAYNNLGIPGAILYDMVDETDFTQKSSLRQNPYFQLVLRNQAFGSSVIAQAVNKQPTFVTLWIGNNDVLGYATSGGVNGTDASGTMPTDSAVFAGVYGQVAGALAQTGAHVAVANIPDVSSIPYFTTYGPAVGQALQGAMSQNPQVPGLFYQKKGETVASSFATPNDLFTGKVLLTLLVSSYSSELGKPSGKYYSDMGITPPAGIDTDQPFGFHPQNPIPTSLVLDPDELEIVRDRIEYFNSVIAGAVSTYNNQFVLVDVHALLNKVRSNDMSGGTEFGGITFTTGFVSGGLFSLDGVHPTTRGYGVLANEFIKSINTKFDANISEVIIGALPGSIPIAEN